MSNNYNKKVLKLSSGGIPIEWISIEEAAHIIFRDSECSNNGVIAWTIGENYFRIMGGTNITSGKRSYIDIPEIIAVKDSNNSFSMAKRFNIEHCKNRENLTCAYCNKKMPRSMLTMDHIYPKSRGGILSYKNTVASCTKCNNKKGNRTPEEAKMPLILKPFIPTMAEIVYSQNILHATHEQKKYLCNQFKNFKLRDYLLNAYNEYTNTSDIGGDILSLNTA